MRRALSLVLVVALFASMVVLAGCDSSTAEKAPLTFMQFYDPECPFCQAMEPIVENLRAEYEPKIESFQIIDVSTDEGRAQAEEFGVFITPTFFLLDADGETLDKISGAATEENMKKFIDRGIDDVTGEATGPKEEIPTEGGTEQ
ncbi:MAG: thioredoxin family protein [Coriobacteriia bacterium]|nr:thioredoxin family protein [Coriobacteriia bacterium]MBN2821929.1 thioredoxin family protein [Coriobacteriia bacterium]